MVRTLAIVLLVPIVAIGVARLVLVTGLFGQGAPSPARRVLAAPASAAEPQPTTPIKHLVVLMQENHSFDNYFGTFPGADGIPPDACMPITPIAPEEGCIRPFHLEPGRRIAEMKEDTEDVDVQVVDLDHSQLTFRTQRNDGRMDGFVYALNRRGQDGRVSMGYYDERDLPYYWKIARDYVLFDRLFTSANGGSFHNHLFWVAAATGGSKDGTPTSALPPIPTIFDRLEEKGISWKFYIQSYDPQLNYRTVTTYIGNRGSQVVWAPILAMDRFLDDPRYSSKIVDLDEYFADLDRGTLPAVAYIVPSGASEHPPGSIQSGQRSVVTLIHALMASSAWNSSAFMWTYDDWGGWYDHVLPPEVDAYGYGFRVPALLVSPYAKRGHIEHATLDFTSILKFIQENWQLEPLADRDALANSIAGAFDFSQQPRPAAFINPYMPTAANTKPSPRGLIYGAYGAAVAACVLLITLSVKPSMARRFNPMRLPPMGGRKGRTE